MKTNLRFKYPLTLCETEFLCDDILEVITEKKKKMRVRPADRATRIPMIGKRLTFLHDTVMAACTEVPVLLSELKALRQLDFSEGVVKDKTVETVQKNANLRYDTDMQVAQNQWELAQLKARERGFWQEEVKYVHQDEVKYVQYKDDVGSRVTPGEDEAKAQAGAEEAELQAIMAAAPDDNSAYAAMIKWYSVHPEAAAKALAEEAAEEEARRLAEQDETAKKAAAAAKRRMQYAQRQREPDAVLGRQLRKDPDVKNLREALKAQAPTITVQDDPVASPRPDVVEQLLPSDAPLVYNNVPPPVRRVAPVLPMSSISAVASTPVHMDLEDDPLIRQEVEKCAQEDLALKRKHEIEEGIKRLEANLRLEKMRAEKLKEVPAKRRWFS